MSKNCIKGVVNQKYFNNPRVSFEIDKIVNEQDNPTKPADALQSLVEEYDLRQSGKTQVATTAGTYRKAKEKYFPQLKGSEILDYGAGKGIASRELGFDSLEPNPEGWTPDYTDASQVKKKYKGIISNAVLNVLPRNIRDTVAKDIGNKLAVGGKAFINVRAHKGDVDRAKNPKQYDDGIITTKGTFQKGFDKDEIVMYLQSILGPNFKVEKSPLGTVGAVITRLK